MREQTLALLTITAALAGCEDKQQPPEREQPPAPVTKAQSSEKTQTERDRGTTQDSKPLPAKELEQLRSIVDSWLDSQNRSEWKTYESLLAPDFVGIKRAGERTTEMDREEWLKDRRSLSTQAPKVTIGRPHFLRKGEKVAAEFEQTWVSKGFADKGSKVLTFAKAKGSWLIEREEMLVSRVLSKSEKAAQGAARSLCEGLASGSNQPGVQTWRFADVGGLADTKWRPVGNWEEAHKLAPSGLYEVTALKKRGDELLIWKEISSPSGDSFVYTQECYRSDGTLAWWEESYRTFHTTAGLGEAVTEASFTPQGKLGAKRRTLRAMETGQPLTADDFFWGGSQKEMTKPTVHLREQKVFTLLPEQIREGLLHR